MYRLLRPGCLATLSLLVACAARHEPVPVAGPSAASPSNAAPPVPLAPGAAVAPSCGPPSDVACVRWTEVKVLTRVQPVMPPVIRSWPPGDYPCKVRFYIDEQGVPYQLDFANCPEELQPSAREAAWQWRFSPMTKEGQPQKAMFILTIVYRTLPPSGPCWF
jgi:hypothetical protein